MPGDVLLVDDDDAERRLIQNALAHNGVQTDPATCGDAPALFAAHPYRIVVAAWSDSCPPLMDLARAAASRPIVILIIEPHSQAPPELADIVSLVVKRPLDAALLGQLTARCISPKIADRPPSQFA
jgi:CheY-like chemotaxis protein